MRAGAKSKKRVNFFYLLVFLVFISVFIICLYIILKWGYETQKSKSVNSKIISEVIKNTDSNIANSESLEIDFKKLLEMNDEIVAWIKIDGTDINYPIAKGNDNSFYLYKNVFKENSQNGCIFMDYRNNEDFSDNNTIIFGHNIKSGIMFSDLKKIYNGSINSNIYIYTKSGQVNKYIIYSSYMQEPDELSINPHINDTNYSDFVKELSSRSINKYNTKLTNNKTITLSTCDSTGKKRILVHGIKQ